MNFDSDDDEKMDPSKVKRSAAGLKSIFASDDRSKQSGSQSLRYEGPKGAAGSGEEFNFNQPSKNNNPGAPPVPAAGSSTIACNGAIHAYKGDQPIGAAAIVVANSSAAGTVCVIIDREKRHLCRVKVNSEQFQLLPNPQQRQYATLYDPAFGGHWTVAFKGTPECNAFITGAMTVQHFLLLPDGPRPPFVELAVASESAGPLIKKNDTVQISLFVWLLAKKGSMTSIGKLVDEIVDEAPRRIVVGDGSVMAGVEDALIGMGVGGRKIVFIPPKKTKMNGLGNPEIGPNDTVAALVSVASIEPYDHSMGLEDAQRSAAQANLAANARRDRGMSVTGKSAAPNARSSSQFGGGGRGGSSTQNQQPAVAASGGAADTNTLLQALLLKQLTGGDSGSSKKKKKRHSSSDDEENEEESNSNNNNKKSKNSEASKKNSEKTLESAAFVERSLAMIQQQLSGLYEKLDRNDMSKKLEENNQKIERIVKKAVGKSPVLDVDVEDAGKDKEELLAKIEQLKEKAEQHKADYYAALETMGKHKDDSSALRNDIQIAIRTGEEKLTELKERHRLEVVDNEVRYRRELDRVAKSQFEEGKDKGYNEGFSMGRIEGLTQSGSASTEELREKLAQKESENLELQSRLVEMEANNYQERRAALEQQATLQGLIDRLEQRNANKEKSVVDQGAMNAKFLRRVMNSTYSHIEEQFYATEKESIPVADALAMVLISVKSETRQAAEELKKLALVQAKEPTPMQPLPFETASTAAIASEVAKKSPRRIEGYTASNSSSVPMPPPPPPMMMMKSSANNNTNNSDSNNNLAASGSSAQDLSAQIDNDYNMDNNQDENSSSNNKDGLDEDYIQKMLAEYRSQREKELSSGGGNDETTNDNNNAKEPEEGEETEISYSSYKQVEEQPKRDEEDDEEENSGHHHHHHHNEHHHHHHHHEEEEHEDAQEDEDEDEDEEPAPVKRSAPKPPRPAQAEDDEW